MLLFIGDLNCRYWQVNKIIGVAERYFNETVSSVIQLGDFGLFETPLNNYFNRHEDNFFSRPAYFIDGNHEDFLFFEVLAKAFSRQFTYLPRGSLHTFSGVNFLCLGGSAYMDPVNTPAGAVIRESDIDACLSYSPEDVDIIITHDCPAGIGVEGTPGFEYCGEPGFPRSRRMRKYFSQKTWIFAHHHRFYEYSDENGCCYGLPEAGNGFAVMKGDGQITLVEYNIDEKGKSAKDSTERQPLCKNMKHCLTY